MKTYEYIEGIATADAAFDAYGKDLNELFQNAALATTALMIDITTLRATIKKTFTIAVENTENLLFKFIDNIIFLKDSEQLLFKQCKVSVDQKHSSLIAECLGDMINPKKQKLGVDVKAITYHKFKLEQKNNIWKARIVLDI